MIARTMPARRVERLLLAGCIAVTLCAASLRVAVAQAPPKAKAPPAATKPSAPAPKGSAPASKAPASKAPAAAPADNAAREKILHSPQWQSTIHEFDQWLSAQSLYDPAEVKQIKARLNVGVQRMTAGQLEWFENDLQDKLKVLQSDQARDASAYLAQTFAVASPAYARKLRAKLPDVLTMTAAQINQQLTIFASKHQATIDMQQAFNDGKQQEIAYNQAQLAAREQESERALDRAQAGAAAAGSSNNFTPARDYFPDAGNDGPFGPGTSVGFFGGGGFF